MILLPPSPRLITSVHHPCQAQCLFGSSVLQKVVLSPWSLQFSQLIFFWRNRHTLGHAFSVSLTPPLKLCPDSLQIPLFLSGILCSWFLRLKHLGHRGPPLQYFSQDAHQLEPDHISISPPAALISRYPSFPNVFKALAYRNPFWSQLIHHKSPNFWVSFGCQWDCWVQSQEYDTGILPWLVCKSTHCFSIFWRYWVWNKYLTLTRQIFYHLNHAPIP